MTLTYDYMRAVNGVLAYLLPTAIGFALSPVGIIELILVPFFSSQVPVTLSVGKTEQPKMPCNAREAR